MKIHAVTVAGRDIFHMIDPEILRAAYEDLKMTYANPTA